MKWKANKCKFGYKGFNWRSSLLNCPDSTYPEKQIPDYLFLNCSNWHNDLDGFVGNIVRDTTIHFGF